MEIVNNSVEMKFYFHAMVELSGFTALVNVECYIYGSNDDLHFEIEDVLDLWFLDNKCIKFDILETPLPIEVEGKVDQLNLRSGLYKKLYRELYEDEKLNNYINKQRMLIYTNKDLN